MNIPELSTTPTPGQCYNQQWSVVVDIPLSNLVQGTNIFEGTSGGQTCYNFNWGQWGWYGIIIRVYYNSSKLHPTGQIISISPSASAIFGENPVITASASSNAGIDKVEFLAYYDGYDTDGDGIFQDYQKSYHKGLNDATLLISNNVGTATTSPYQVTWNTDIVPDQTPGSIKLIAKIRDKNGVWFETDPIQGLTLQRIGTSVKLYKPLNVPENFWVSSSQGQLKSSKVNIPSTHNLANAQYAKLLVKTWNGVDGAAEAGQNHYTKVNNWIAPNYGQNHYYSFDILTVPTSALINGDNTISFSSQSAHHGIEILWPGPALIVRYNYPVP